MKVMVIVKASVSSETGIMPDVELLEAMGAFLCTTGIGSICSPRPASKLPRDLPKDYFGPESIYKVMTLLKMIQVFEMCGNLHCLLCFVFVAWFTERPRG